MNMDDIWQGIAECRKKGEREEVLMINPEDYYEIISDERFVSMANYVMGKPIGNGEVGKLFGMKVIVTSSLPQGQIRILSKNDVYRVKEWNPSER